MLDISVPAKVLFHLGPVPVTNAVVAAYVSTGVLVVIALLIRRSLSSEPGRLQAFMELLFEYIDNQLLQAFGDHTRARKFFPLIMTLLLFIAIANQLSVFPLIFQVLVEDKPLLRLATSDLSQTLTLGLVVVILSHIVALSMAPLKHIGNYFRIGAILAIRSPKDIGNALIEVFLGIMDLIGELSKIISISCRLFGNLFAGDVMVAVIVSLSAFTQFIVPMPFIFLGIFSGFVQALVFSLLSIQFIAGLVNTAAANKEARLNKGKQAALEQPATA